jgi:hypothetical protein
MCPVCGQRPCAVNYYRDGEAHYRSRCESCARRNRGLKPRVPLWQSQGYKKKMVCDRCGFRARYSAQISVYHADGRLDNAAPKNLKSICKNCEIAVSRDDLPWRLGDLEADV